MEYQGGALEAIVVRILRRELAVAKRLDAAGPVAPITAPRAPCQLYVHMPFCESLCPFCSFHRVEYREDKSRSYFKSVRRELRLYRYRGFQFRDVSIGGGTPTVNPGELLKTIRLIRSFWDIRSLSVETHPNDLTPHVLDGLQSARVDRLSVGVQSFDDVLLRAMGRVHAHESAAAIVGRRRLHMAGIAQRIEHQFIRHGIGEAVVEYLTGLQGDGALMSGVGRARYEAPFTHVTQAFLAHHAPDALRVHARALGTQCVRRA